MTFSRPTDDQENRVRGVIDDLIGVETPDDIMENLIGVLSEVLRFPRQVTIIPSFIVPRHQEHNMTNILS